MHSVKTPATLLNQLVRALKKRLRHGNAERLGGLEIDTQPELARLLHRQIRRLLAFQDTPGINTGLATDVRVVRTEANEAAGSYKEGRIVRRGNGMLLCQSSNAISSRKEKLIASDEKRVSAQLGERREGRLDLVVAGSL